jgi:hypothetical protein
MDMGVIDTLYLLFNIVSTVMDSYSFHSFTAQLNIFFWSIEISSTHLNSYSQNGE